MNTEIEIQPYSNVKDLVEKLGCELPTGIAFMPRNLDEVDSKDLLVHELSVQTLRTLLKEANIVESKFEPVGVKFKYIQENSYLSRVVIFVGAALLFQDQNVTAIALGVVANYFSEKLRSEGKKPSSELIKMTVIVEEREGLTYTQINYEGPPTEIKLLNDQIHLLGKSSDNQ